ncbi:unnamed protein product [Moneuplotes crassus]|uniref:DBF4-type domain-containing protein n=1 Tax=Euplotes crassus TaxID=5936 RepID=A0AAD1U8P5_EUPCR|nr:unnamed protein product [Moneuplotes crassus]
MSILDSHQKSRNNLGKPEKIDSIYKNLFKKISRCTHYASELKKRADIGRNLIQKHMNLSKIKFYIYLPHSKSQPKKQDLIGRIQKLNGEVSYSVSKSISFLVVSDQTFKLSNKSLLQGGAFLDEAGPSENNLCENRAQQSITQCKEFLNDRSLRLLSSSSSFGNDPKTIMKGFKSVSSKTINSKPEFNNLYEFLNCKRWNLITVSDLEYKLNILESSTLDWHIDRGFAAKRSKEAAHFVITKIIMRRDERCMHSHTFQFNPKINKYDVSKMNLEAPEGTSIFQTAQENEMAIENFVKLLSKHESNVHNLGQVPSCHSQIEEQQPLNCPTMCTICEVKAFDYQAHLNSSTHKKFMKKYTKEYKKIDELCEELNLQNSSNIKRPKKRKTITFKNTPNEEPQVKPKRRQIKRRSKQQTKEENRISQYVQDRLVIMQIETKSQPYSNKINNQSNSILEQSNTKNSNDVKKCYSQNSNDSCGLEDDCVRPYPYFTKSVRRHIAKRPKKAYDYDVRPPKRTKKRIKRNKRLRQTYFATDFKKLRCTLDGRDVKRPRLKDTRIDEYFPRVSASKNDINEDME